MTSIHDFTARDIDGNERSLDAWRGQVLLVVNVASKCGFTPQYEGLQNLHAGHDGKGFAVLGFPCNQFGQQEPGDEAQIRDFCTRTYDVDFPMFAKIEVNGANTHPLYRWLKHAGRGVLGSEAIKWNFTKFLVGRDGQVIRRYAPVDAPEKIAADIDAALAHPLPTG